MLNAKSLGLAGGTIWGLWLFVFTFINLYTGYGPMFAGLMADVYPGYEVTVAGSFVGLIYGFLDGSIGLFLLGWLYNKFNTWL